jgi:hypothetical protein
MHNDDGVAANGGDKIMIVPTRINRYARYGPNQYSWDRRPERY